MRKRRKGGCGFGAWVLAGFFWGFYPQISQISADLNWVLGLGFGLGFWVVRGGTTKDVEGGLGFWVGFFANDAGDKEG